jgi:hypothetical protein
MKTIQQLEIESPDDRSEFRADTHVGNAATTNRAAGVFSSTIVGELIGLTDNGITPLVMYAGQTGRSAVAARTVIDLYGAHVGKEVVLVFDGCDPAKPIVVGVLRDSGGPLLEQAPGQIEVDADGRRLVVTAAESLVLRCGAASVTLTKEGKILLQGSYVSSYSTGVNRVRGGSVQIN